MAILFKPDIIGLRNDTLAPFNGNHRMTPLVTNQPERHCHDYWELYIHVRGGQYYSVEDQMVELTENMLIINPPFSMHGLMQDRNLVCYERVFVDVTTPTLERAGNGLINLPDLFQKSVGDKNFFFPMTEESVRECMEIVAAMKSAWEHSSVLGDFDAYVHLLRYLQVICHTIEGARPIASSPATYPLMQQVLMYLDAHFTEPLTLGEVARAFNISVSYLSHEFARFNRRSVYDYILYRRVMLACELVRTGSNMTSAAYQCGFNNYNTFMRAFKKIVGMSPSEYHKQSSSGSIYRR